MKIKKLYGGSTSTTQPVQSSNVNNPWAPTIPYLQSIYGDAAKLYAQGPTQYTPWSQAAGLSQDQQAQVNGTNAYVNSQGTQNFLQQGNQAVSNLMSGANNPYSGITNAGNPQLAGYLSNNTGYDPSQGLNNFMYQNSSDPNMQASVAGAANQAGSAMDNINSLVQNGSGFGQNMAQNYGNIASNNAIDTTLGQNYDAQNANRLQATNMAQGIQNNKANLAASNLYNQGQYANDALNLGISNYANMLGAPVNLLQQLYSAGGINQAQNQAQINNATNQWNFDQQSNYNNLARMVGLTTPNNAWSSSNTSGTTTTTTPSSGMGAGIGGLAGMIGAGLLAIPTGGMSMAALPGIMGAAGLGGALGSTGGGLISGGR